MGLISGPKPAPYPWELSHWNNDIYRKAAENIVRQKAQHVPPIEELFEYTPPRVEGYQALNNTFDARRGGHRRFKVR